MLEHLSAHAYTQAQLGERMQEEWAASLERAQQLSGGGGRRPGATILEACTLDPKAWHGNVPSLLCASSSVVLSLPPNPESSPEECEHPVTASQEVGRPAHRVPEARESVFGPQGSGPCVHTCSKAQGLASPCWGQPLSRTSSSANLEMAKDNRNSWESPACPPPQRPCKWSRRP